MRSLNFKEVTLGCLSASVLSACLGTEPSVKNTVQEKPHSSPVVEAYVEYPGPDRKWVGPKDFIIHIDTTHEGGKGGNSEIIITKDERSVRTGPAIEKTREMLKDLESSVQGGATLAPIGCLSPVRVRLIRADGGITQRQSCRGQAGWPLLASQLTDLFFEGISEQDAGVKPEETKALEKVVEGAQPTHTMTTPTTDGGAQKVPSAAEEKSSNTSKTSTSKEGNEAAVTEPTEAKKSSGEAPSSSLGHTEVSPAKAEDPGKTPAGKTDGSYTFKSEHKPIE